MEDRDELIRRLFDEEYERLIKKAYRLSGDISRAQDHVQETFLFALVHHSKLAAHPNPGAWLSTVLFNLAMNDRRRWDNSRSVSLEQLGDVLPAESTDTLLEIMPKKLREDEKQLLVLRFEYRLSCTEIAERLGVSDTACRTRLSRLIRKIRKYIDSPERK